MKHLVLILAVVFGVVSEAYGQGSPKARYQVRRGTYANIPASGGLLPYEPFWVTDSLWLIIGDTVAGVSTYHRVANGQALLDSAAALRSSINSVASDVAALDDSVKFMYLPFFSEVYSGTSWSGGVNGDYDVGYAPFNVTARITPDSVLIHLISGIASDDSIKFGIYSFDGQTKLCESAWIVPNGTSNNQRRSAAWTTTQKLEVGSYLYAWTHNRGSGTGIPATWVLGNGTGAINQFLPALMDGNRYVGYIDGGATASGMPATLTGGTNPPAASATHPVVIILGL